MHITVFLPAPDVKHLSVRNIFSPIFKLKHHVLRTSILHG